MTCECLFIITIQVLQTGNSILTISQARASNGRSCVDLLPEFLSGDDDDDDDDDVRFILCTAMLNMQISMTYYNLDINLPSSSGPSLCT